MRCCLNDITTAIADDDTVVFLIFVQFAFYSVDLSDLNTVGSVGIIKLSKKMEDEKMPGLTSENIVNYCAFLREREKSPQTIEKYIRDAERFGKYAAERELTKELALEYKNSLIEAGYAVNTVNSMLASLNSLLCYLGHCGYTVKRIKIQRNIYISETKVLNREEYGRLVEEALKRDRCLWLIMQTICSTGIRVSELKYFTVEAVKRGEVSVSCKGKIRTVLLPGKLKRLIMDYISKNKLKTGTIFIDNNGNPLSRGSIWGRMKRLAKHAKVSEDKVFPHNLRKLFARTFYETSKDIAKLADILGHGSIETTRIYIMTTGSEHRRRIESLGLVIDIKIPVT